MRFVRALQPILLAAIALALLPTSAAQAAAQPRFSVNSTGDAHGAAPLDDGVCATAYTNGKPNGVCTLRAAVEEANTVSGGGAIIDFAGVSSPAAYTLVNGAITMSQPMTVVGAGPKNTVIDGDGPATHARVFTVYGRPTSISGVTITDGHLEDPTNAWGGAILDGGDLTLTNVVIRDNSASGNNAYGGGIMNESNGALTIVDSVISNNHVDPGNSTSKTANGGGVYSGNLTIVNSTVTGNTATYSGGGIGSGGNTTIANTTVSGNTGKDGGGVWANGTDTITNSTLSGNDATEAGGGFFQWQGTGSLYNVTVSGNTANSDASGTGLGGGIAPGTNGSINFRNTIVSGNYYVYLRNNFPVLDSNDCSGTVSSLGNNIFGTTTNCTVNGPHSAANPALESLANNGGPTRTQGLGTGSRAIDKGQSGGCTDSVGAAIRTDQRGARRPVDGNGSHTAECDIGAFEAGSFPRVEEHDRRIKYDGWRGVGDPTASSGQYRVSNVKNEIAAFAFTGHAVTWNTRKGPMMGKAQVLIDGSSKGTFDLRALNTKPYALTFSPLPAGRHTIVVKVLHQTSGRGYDVLVDSFAIGTSSTDDGSCAVTYDSWKCTSVASASGHARRSSAAPGATTSFSFNGSNIQWLTAVGGIFGRAKVCIGSSCSTVSLSTGASTRLFGHLGSGTHRLRITVLGSHDTHSTGNAIVVDAFSGPIAIADS